MTEFVLEENWDKVFKKNENVEHTKVTFHNRYGIVLVGDLYRPKQIIQKLPGIAVCGPFGAVKEQSSGLYAQELASRGFVALAFDPSFTGESGGNVRNVASPDINTEDFQAAIDFLSILDIVDENLIGIVGICGWGGLALNTATIDTRIKATITMTMYDMTRVNIYGYFDSRGESERYKLKKELNSQRILDYKNKFYKRAGGVIDPLPSDAPQFVKDYYSYYKTDRGYHARSLNSNEGFNTTSSFSFLSMPILQLSHEIRSAVLMIHGKDAHSCYFSEDAYKKLIGSNKELFILPDCNHVDLYDQFGHIPFEKIEQFLNNNLKQEDEVNV